MRGAAEGGRIFHGLRHTEDLGLYGICGICGICGGGRRPKRPVARGAESLAAGRVDARGGVGVEPGQWEGCREGRWGGAGGKGRGGVEDY
mgnify:CR=1 FL=1